MSDDKEIADIKKLPTEQKIVHKVSNHNKIQKFNKTLYS